MVCGAASANIHFYLAEKTSNSFQQRRSCITQCVYLHKDVSICLVVFDDERNTCRLDDGETYRFAGIKPGLLERRTEAWRQTHRMHHIVSRAHTYVIRLHDPSWQSRNSRRRDLHSPRSVYTSAENYSIQRLKSYLVVPFKKEDAMLQYGLRWWKERLLSAYPFLGAFKISIALCSSAAYILTAAHTHTTSSFHVRVVYTAAPSVSLHRFSAYENEKTRKKTEQRSINFMKK